MMKQFTYALRNFVRDRQANIVKIVSITLGLFIALVIFSKIGFTFTCNDNYKGADKVFMINSTYVVGGEVKGPGPYVVAPLPAAIREYFPELVESSTVVRPMGKNVFYQGSQSIGEQEIVYADASYFYALGIDILEGDPEELNNTDVIFISRSLARNIFGTHSPVGEVLKLGNSIEMTIKGVHEDLPENCTFPHDTDY